MKPLCPFNYFIESTLPLRLARSGPIKPTTLPLWTDGFTALSYKVIKVAENVVSCLPNYL